VYLGNDVNDIDCLALVGCGAVVADAHPAATKAARLILQSKGGAGAVREMCDLILRRMGVA
jgi:N-acylneuraminate cytidylyltransferase